MADLTTHIERNMVTDALRTVVCGNNQRSQGYALEASDRTGVASRTAGSHAAVAVQTASKTCVVNGRRSGGMAHRAVGTTEWHVIGRWCHDGEACGWNRVFGCIGDAVTLRTVRRGRRRTVLVNQRIGWMHREVLIGRRNVGVAGRTRRGG